MTTNLQIRDARDADRAAIESVTLAAYEEYAPTMGEMWKFYRANTIETLAKVKPAEQIVAERKEGIVGTVLLYPVGNTVHAPNGTVISFDLPEIRLLAVTPAARGQGVSTALMQECVLRARQSGAGTLSLHTTDLMKVAMQMYERMGFGRDPERDFHPAHNVVVKAFRLELVKAHPI